MFHWILLIAVLYVWPFGIIFYVVRGGAMIDAPSSAYVKTACSKGVKALRIIFIHALCDFL